MASTIEYLIEQQLRKMQGETNKRFDESNQHAIRLVQEQMKTNELLSQLITLLGATHPE